ncbi:MAG: NAD(P)/FAD-dependent oxidoreductase [Thermoanaerobaculia bacterium]|nr:NAD(P)/FAD-dependent oxidoreductase [Thermoanaerobaculia bacterium]
MLDVLVVGGGPAGLATAIGCRHLGLTVAVVERGEVPRDKPCGEGLMPHAVAALNRLGVQVEDLGYRFDGIRYLLKGRVAEGHFRHGFGVGVRRTRLQEALAEAATEVGVELHWGCRVDALVADRRDAVEAQTTQGSITARFGVGADGLLSSVRRWAGLEGGAARRRRFGVRRHYRIAPWASTVEVYWAPHCEAYVTPVADEEVGVAILWSGGTSSFDSLLENFPRLASRLAGAPSTSRDRGAGPFDQRVRGVVAGRIALVGDASGYVDAITGEGVGMALLQAEVLTRALAVGDLRRYSQAHPSVGRRVRWMTRGLLALERSPRLRSSVFAALERYPSAFRAALGWMAG